MAVVEADSTAICTGNLILNLQLMAMGTGTLKRKVAEPDSLTVPELATLSPEPTRTRVAGVLTPVRERLEF